MALISINPATGEVIKEYAEISDADINTKLAQADTAYTQWSALTFDERAKYMRAIAQQLRTNVDEYAKILTQEMGKTFAQAKAEVEKSAFNFEHYAEKAPEYLAPRTVETDASESYVSYEPLGTILLIMPWNYPFWQVLRQAAPILMAGNTAVLKHASNVSGASVAMEKLMLDAGLPQGVFQSLLISSAKVESILADERIKGVSLTGSEYAGSIVAAQAGKEIKPAVMELGGSDASIILEDADIDLAVEVASLSRLQNNGQSCIGSKRFIVHEDIYDEFIQKLQAKFESQVIGDPMDENTTLGPVVSEAALNELLDQIERSVAAGAQVLHGGKRQGEIGFYLQPTILVNVTKDVPSYHEELFGPVVSIIKVKDEAEAIAVANDTRFGLGASIYTQNIERAKNLVPKITSGAVFINGLVKSDPRLPFGGVKKSGFGRELSAEGIRAFCNVKTVWIK